MKVCKINGCDGRSDARAMCRTHYNRWKRGTLEPRPSEPCKVEGCAKPRRTNHDWCHSHLSRYYRFGDPTAEAHPGAVCEIEGCGKRMYRIGLCAMHAKRKEVHGDPLAEVRPMPSRDDPRLPIQPFLDYVAEHGGLTEALDNAGLTKDRRNNTQKAVDRARERGEWSIPVADRTIIRLYGLHPFEVYGDAWWTEEIHDDLGVAA